MRLRRLLLAALAALAVLVLLVGCRTLGYVAHVTRGHFDLMARREPIAELLADPQVDPTLRAELAPVPEARRFASDVLDLPDNGSYTDFVALDRRYVTWNVFATAEFSVEPVKHCFPFTGCVGYRGYFSRERAEAEAARLRADGYQTFVGGVLAYSTLGWFDDPVLSTMPLDRRDRLVGTIFHELAHQKLYVPGDTAFNESYASFVERQGLIDWRRAEALVPDPADPPDYRPVVERILALRERLATIYASGGTPAAMRIARDAAIADFRADYRAWRATPQGRELDAYDDWVAAPIDNAKLVPYGLYDQWLPAFEGLFAEVGGDWQAFHRRAAEIGKRPAEQRQAELARLADRSTSL